MPRSEDACPPSRASKAPRSRARRWGRGAVGVLIAIPLTWLLVVNLTLWTGLVAWAVSGPRPRTSIELRHGFAWCVWPTRVHVHDLRLEVHATRWRLEASLPYAEVDVALHELVSRRLRVERLAAEDVELTLAPPRTAGPELSAYAEAKPARTQSATPRTASADGSAQAWRIVLERLDLELERVRLVPWQAELDGHLVGDATVTVGHRVGVPEVALRLRELTLRREDTVILEDASMQVRGSMHEHDPSTQPERATLRMLSGELAVRGKVASLAWIDELGAGLPASIRGGAGSLHGDLAVYDGVLSAGSHLHYQTDALRLVRRRELGDLSLRGTLTLDATMHHEPHERPRPRLRAELRGLEGHAEGTDDPWLTAPRLAVTATASSADLADAPWSVASARASLPSFRVSDLGAVERLGTRIRLYGGSLAGHASARLKDRPGVYALGFEVDVDGAHLGIGGSTRVRTDGFVRSQGTVDVPEHVLRLEPLHATLRDLRITSSHGRSQHDWLEVHRATVRHRWSTKRLWVDARGRLASLQPVLTHLRPGDDLRERVPDLAVVTEPIDYELELRRTPTQLTVEVEQLERPPLDVVATIATQGDAVRAVVYFEGVNVGATTTGGEQRNVEAAVERAWYRRKQAWVRAVGER